MWLSWKHDQKHQAKITSDAERLRQSIAEKLTASNLGMYVAKKSARMLLEEVNFYVTMFHGFFIPIVF